MIRILLTALVVVTCYHPSAGQSRELTAIEQAARAGDWKRVESLAIPYLKKNPADKSAAYVLPLAQMRLGSYERALTSAKALRMLDTSRAQPWLMVSECEVALNRTADAVATLRAAQTRFPDDVQIPWALGMTLARSGRYEDAIAPLEEAMYRRPDVPSISEQLAECYHATGRFSESAELYQTVLEQSPSRSRAWLKYGESLLLLNKLDSAQRAFATVIQLQPDSAAAYLALTAVYTERKQPDSARMIARALTVRRPQDPQGWYNLGLLSLSAKQPDSAIRCFRSAIALQSNYPEAYFNLALAYEDQGFLEDAAVALQRCALMSPTLAPDAYNSLAIIYRREGRFDDAIATHAQAIALRDTSAVFHASRLNTYFEATRCTQAVPLIDQAKMRFPTNVDILYAAARCYVRLGRQDEARVIEQRLSESAPSLAEQLRFMMK